MEGWVGVRDWRGSIREEGEREICGEVRGVGPSERASEQAEEERMEG